MMRRLLGERVCGHVIGRGCYCSSAASKRGGDPSRSINLSAQQDYIIKENLKDIHIEQVPRTNEIRIGDKVPPNIELHAFPPLVVEKVPQVKTYKFFITENQIVVVNPQNLIADIIK